MTLPGRPTAAAPALVLRCWRDDDVDALVEAHRDPELRARTPQPVDHPGAGEALGGRQPAGLGGGPTVSFAVCEPTPGGERLVACVLLKDVLPGRADAEIGYWTAGPARGREVACGRWTR